MDCNSGIRSREPEFPLSLSGVVKMVTAEPTLFAVGEWTVKPGKEETFLARWEEFARWTMDNLDGTGEVFLLRGAEQKNRFISFGSWQSQEAMAAWRQHPRFREAFLQFRELCDEITPATMEAVVHLAR